MKSFARLGSLVIALGVAGLLAGCYNQRSTHAARPTGTARDFEVVESSAKRPLTEADMTHLREAVAHYLEKEGAVARGDYYVKVFLAPDQNGVSSEWVIVRFTRDTDLRFVMVGTYPAYSYGDRPYAAYDYYPYGYGSFGRISFHYYDDPYYGYHYYHPRPNHHGGNHSPKPDGGSNHHHSPTPPSPPRFKPIDPVGTPQVTQTRQDGNPPASPAKPSERYVPRHGGIPRSTPPERTTERNNNPPPQHASQPASTRDTATSAPTRTDSNRSESTYRSSPTYTPPTSREESIPSSSSNQSQREANQAAAQRERLEN